MPLTATRHPVMRGLNLLCVAVIALLPALTHATPQDYVISFSQFQGNLPASAGSFTYDPDAGFSNFHVTWNGVSYDLSAVAGRPTTYATGVGYGLGTHADSFALLANTLPQPRSYTGWAAYTVAGGTLLGFTSGAGVVGVSESVVAFSVFVPPGGLETGVHAGNFTISAVPEPTSAALLLGGLLGLPLLARRRRAA